MDEEHDNIVTIEFGLITRFNEYYHSTSTVSIENDSEQLLILGNQLDVFLRQVGYARDGNTIFMESVKDSELDVLEDFLESYRDAKAQGKDIAYFAIDPDEPFE